MSLNRATRTRRRRADDPSAGRAVDTGRIARPPRGLEVGEGLALVAGWSDEVIVGWGEEDGKAQLLTPAWGNNRELHAPHAMADASHVATELVGHELRSALGEVGEEQALLAAEFHHAEQRALDAVDEAAAATKARRDLVRQMTCEGVGTPSLGLRRLLGEASLMALLVVGDVFFIATAFQIFGLSDQRAFGILPVSELTVGAVSALVALVLTARYGGINWVRFTHALAVRRDGRDEGAGPVRGVLARARTGMVLSALGVAGAVAVLMGISQVRAAYLAQNGISAHAGVFMLIQAGVAVAAFLVAVHHAHPYDVQWRQVVRQEAAAAVALDAACSKVARLVGRHEALTSRRDAVIGMHHQWAWAILAGVPRQQRVYLRAQQLAQPEPVQEQMLTEGLPEAREPEWLSKSPAIPSIKPATAGQVTLDRIKEMRERHRSEPMPVEAGKAGMIVLPELSDLDGGRARR